MSIQPLNHPIPADELPADLAEFCRPDVPIAKRKAAAGGLVPLPPPKLITVLYQLAHDPDASIAPVARTTLEKLPEQVLQGGLISAEINPRVLDLLADIHIKNPSVLEAIILNRSVADATMNRLAKDLRDDRLLELVAINEQRLLRAPQIIENFYLNRHARMSTAQRLVELAVRNNVELKGLPVYREIMMALSGQAAPEPEKELAAEPTATDLMFQHALAVGGEAFKEAGEFGETGEEEEFDDDLLAEMEFDSFDASGDDDKNNVQFAISKMNVSEKIRLAQIGTGMHRAILIRDTNKLVYESVIKSPAMSIQEVVKISMNRSMHEDVIRIIADNRDWTKMYSIKANLVNNPKTPLGKAMGFLSHLRDRDLKAVAANKNIPSSVATAAKNLLKRKSGG